MRQENGLKFNQGKGFELRSQGIDKLIFNLEIIEWNLFSHVFMIQGILDDTGLKHGDIGLGFGADFKIFKRNISHLALIVEEIFEILFSHGFGLLIVRSVINVGSNHNDRISGFG